MNLADLLGTGGVHVPWPTAIGEKVVNGSLMAISPICEKKCGRNPACHTLPESTGDDKVCEHGLSYYHLRHGEDRLTVFGVRGPNNPRSSDRQFKQNLKGRSVDVGQVADWLRSLDNLVGQIDHEFLCRQKELLDPLHDPIRLASQIQTIANSMLGGNGSYEERLQRANTDLKSLIKASDLLNDYFQLLSIYFNPASASYGRQSLISVHGLLRKLVSILGIEDHGAGVRVFLSGASYRNVLVHESFKLIPLALISNAVKYSMAGDVRVSIQELQSSVEVSVVSQGPLIERSELSAIFAKRVRGKWAEKVSDGTGVGLYLAGIVAAAHGISIKVTSSPTGTTLEGVPQANNRFWFEVPMGVR